MWVVLKYKPKEFEILKDSFFKILGEMPEFYNPKYKYERYINNKLKTFEKNILNNYLIILIFFFILKTFNRTIVNQR